MGTDIHGVFQRYDPEAKRCTDARRRRMSQSPTERLSPLLTVSAEVSDRELIYLDADVDWYVKDTLALELSAAIAAKAPFVWSDAPHELGHKRATIEIIVMSPQEYKRELAEAEHRGEQRMLKLWEKVSAARQSEDDKTSR